jgi:hypothetical protein
VSASVATNLARRGNSLEYPTRTRIALIYDLAVGELSHRALAKKYGVASSGAISDFKKRHADEIEHQRQHLADKFALLWIAQKEARLAEYQDEAQMMNELADRVVSGQGVIVGVEGADGRNVLDADELEDGPVTDASGSIARLMRARDRALRSVAEELGQLPNRTTIQLGDTTIRHVIEGVDIDKL